MVWAYFDTSALVKRYVEEAGRPEVLRLLRRHEVVASAILPSNYEARCAGGLLKARWMRLGSHRSTSAFQRIGPDWTLIGVSTGVLIAAESLAATHPVRTLDAGTCGIRASLQGWALAASISCS